MFKNVTKKIFRKNKRRNDLIEIFVGSIIMIGFLIVDNRDVLENYSKQENISTELSVKIEKSLYYGTVIYQTEKPTKKTTKISQTEKPTKKTTKISQTEKPTKRPRETSQTKNTSYSEDDLYWLSHVIMAEVGNCTYECKTLCGLVVMNRVHSSSFKAETIKEVIFSPGQYATVDNGRIYMDPNEECIEIAEKILSGTIEFEIPENVVYQAQFRQGSGIYKKIGSEYFCYDD